MSPPDVPQLDPKFLKLIEPRINIIKNRWRVEDLRWPWLLRPCTVRILFYADFISAYDGGGFDGLKHVLATLNADPYFWVRFSIGKASRVNDTTADAALRSKRLDQINLNDYDELWLFGFNGLPSVLTPAEITAVRAFMDNGGGVLVTGDHADLGAAIASDIPRAGKLRAWAPGVAPSQGGADRHSTLREGHDPGFAFNDQSDDVPQIIRYREYPVSSPSWWQRRTRPHPVLCGPDGPIDVLPDHMHEGVITIPGAFPAGEWPSKAGFQPKPEVIAWARIVQPGLTKSGTEFPVLGVYDGHGADVGRIVADATWHHWFDINLIGDNGAVIGDTAGFDNTAAGQAALKKIEAYFLNVAIWLAPPAKQVCMRNRLTWGCLWRDPLFMIPLETPIYLLGGFGIDALGKYAPQCTIYRFVLELLDPPVLVKWWDIMERLRPMPPLLEENIFGAVLKPLVEYMHERKITPDKVDPEEVDALLNKAFDRAAVRAGIQASLEMVEPVLKQGRSLLKTMD